MAVKIRLARTGAKKAPYYRIVVADSRARRDGRFNEILGRYNPRMQPSVVELDVEKTREWVAKGAQMTETVEKLLAIAEGTKEAPSAEAKPSKKATAKAEAEAKAAEAAAAAPAPAPEETPAETAEEAPVEDAATDSAEAPAEEPAPEADEPAAEEVSAQTEEAPAEEAPAETEESAESSEAE